MIITTIIHPLPICPHFLPISRTYKTRVGTNIANTGVIPILDAAINRCRTIFNLLFCLRSILPDNTIGDTAITLINTAAVRSIVTYQRAVMDTGIATGKCTALDSPVANQQVVADRAVAPAQPTTPVSCIVRNDIVPDCAVALI
ncbi:hypothetical protein ES703_85564 [subsurface metagenome]